ncbi:hypothetical protein DICPUDRAFT_24967 [Dictyostelium purpureum]|uniref:THH1/TOM1/TOM3 domain-containing protein n=1 Tax=Dictyostelium purpureum TaxID=5786 RepID=F0Z669_DICPU|nr:uncharacterized protein DICPUDRAFT_24967 [Dictyostelium purpureum]EGC40546.1 hypothetical protein DICPUDRAFT_24967 [Dictyostelium purpureum]|eukprot:XP_003282882.1 hypothetical protein DICPUDRAFT_24967 [Dictyostelium purpureum]
MENNVDGKYPFTGDEEYDKLVKAFYIVRGVSFFVLFVLNIVQTYYELLHLKKKKKGPTPRFMTFVSITLFPFCKTLQSFFSIGFADTRTGSVSWYMGIWGTLFLSTEWIFIGCFWTRLLYTFFTSKKIAMGNIKKTWYSAWAITAILFAWNIILMVLVNVKSKTLTASVSSKGFISLVALLGTFLLVNGFVLVINLKTQDKKSNTFQKTISRTLRLSLICLFIVLGMIVREIIVAISKISTSSNYRYAAIFVTFFLEFPQCVVVMVALADDGVYWKNYFKFSKIAKESNSSQTSIHDSSSSGKHVSNGSGAIEIDLNSMTMDDSGFSSKKSSNNIARTNSKTPVSIIASSDSNINSSTDHIINDNNIAENNDTNNDQNNTENENNI